MLATHLEIVVDNSEGGDERFAEEVARGLRDRGLAVELRPASPTAMFDTGVHLVSAGLVIRVSERPDRAFLRGIEEVVRAALLHRPSLRRRTRSVPVRFREGEQTIEWIDVFD
jgi:hypothetical protein